MNDLVAELRAEADACEGDFAIGDYPDARPALYERAADEIERLTAELTKAHVALGAASFAVAERDKLFEQKLAREVAFADLRAERDWLREENVWLRASSQGADIVKIGELEDECGRLKTNGFALWLKATLNELRSVSADLRERSGVVVHGCFCGNGQYGNPRDCPVHGSDSQQRTDIGDSKP